MLKAFNQEEPIIICPSVLAADFTNLAAELETVKNADYLHLDIMDGNFVPNISYGPAIVKQMRPLWDKVFDVHLMVKEPERWVEPFAKAGADLIVFHQEATVHAHRMVQNIRDAGCSAGIAINPATPVEMLEAILPFLDLVLLMTVNPGFGGQAYIPEVESKIRKLKNMVKETGAECRIQVDGGINRETIVSAKRAGAHVFVAGSAIFKAEDRAAEIELLRQLANEA